MLCVWMSTTGSESSGYDSLTPPSPDRADTGKELRSCVAIDTLSPSERLRLWLLSPVVAAALESLAVAAETEPVSDMFVAYPHLLPVLLRCCRIVWDEESLVRPSAVLPILPIRYAPSHVLGAHPRRAEASTHLDTSVCVWPCRLQPVTDSSPWTPSVPDTALAFEMIATHALGAVVTLAGVFPLRTAWLDVGAVPLLLQTAISGSKAVRQRRAAHAPSTTRAPANPWAPTQPTAAAAAAPTPGGLPHPVVP